MKKLHLLDPDPRLKPAQSVFFVSEDESDFYIHESLLVCEKDTHLHVSALVEGGEFYLSINEALDTGEFKGRPFEIMTNLREFLKRELKKIKDAK